jgi:hypothetical protein
MNITRNLNLFAAALVVPLAAATTAQASADTYTNIAKNIAVTLTLYEQNGTNARGGIPAAPFRLTTSWLIGDLKALTGASFGAGPKLVEYTEYFTNNLYVYTIATNNPATLNSGTLTMSFATNTAPPIVPDIESNLVYYVFHTVVTNNWTNFVYTNGYGNTFKLASVTGPTEVLTNNPSKIGILAGDTFTDLSQYFGDSQWSNHYTFFSITDDSAQGSAFGAAGPASYEIPSEHGLPAVHSPLITVPDVYSGSIKNAGTASASFNAGDNRLSIQDFETALIATNPAVQSGATNLYFDVYGLLKETLAIDTLTWPRTNRAPEDVYTGTLSFSGIGAFRGASTTNESSLAGATNYYYVNTYVPTNSSLSATNYYVINYTPVLIDGTITTTLLKKYPQSLETPSVQNNGPFSVSNLPSLNGLVAY